ncbi:hypothetical protein KIP88_19720 [Bradyrhizobium sp. SRL28]|uniref:hypothetical protein n=1 Tax=Bradyrhizobium sp. SRL28 TaxID=2836178 RepID=UPI001BDF0A2D|nr:hypothetical protein [Bradyrhizobium sp. SRL28]MBT1512732.1 hypothetical protein [Bradyrhizobium sp. SRL28]
MAGETDFFARAVSGLALAISAATFIWSRLDKRWERQAAAKAVLPTVRMRFNSNVDEDGYHLLKVGFRNMGRAITFNGCRVLKPRGAVIANWNGKERGKEGSTIRLDWTFDASPNPVHGSDAFTAVLHIKTNGNPGSRIELELSGFFRDGSMGPVELRVAAPVD